MKAKVKMFGALGQAMALAQKVEDCNIALERVREIKVCPKTQTMGGIGSYLDNTVKSIGAPPAPWGPSLGSSKNANKTKMTTESSKGSTRIKMEGKIGEASSSNMMNRGGGNFQQLSDEEY